MYLDLGDAIRRHGRDVIEARYGNLLEMYERISGEDPYATPLRIYPAPHYTMGGLWVDYNLMTNVPGLYAIGEANFSDHGANRLGASALMQGLADGYFVIPDTVAGFLAENRPDGIDTDRPEFGAVEKEVDDKLKKLLSIDGKRTTDSFHRELGTLMWEKCGMARDKAGLEEALAQIPQLREEFWKDVRVLGSGDNVNQSLEKAGRVADYLDFAEVMVRDALTREESCGAHFRTEYQTDSGEARRDDERFLHVAAWEFAGDGVEPRRHEEPLRYESVQPTERSYK